MTTTINASTSSGLVNTADTSGILQLQTASTAAVTINASQNVGVGMTDQTKKLETTGTLATRGSSTNTTWTGAGELAIKNGSGNAYMSFHGDTGTRLSYMQTSVTATELNAETGYLAFSTNAERMRITSGGSVGIGNTAPATNLSVSGNILAGTANAVANGGGFDSYMAINRTGANDSVSYNLKNGTYETNIGLNSSWAFGVYDATATTYRFSINHSGLVYAAGIYSNTSSNSANVLVYGANGDLYRSTSALKYKQDIRDLPSIDINKFRPVIYKSKCDIDDQTIDHFGIIADEVDEAGIKELVHYGDDGQVENFKYDRLTVVLLKALQELNAKVDSQQALITDLTTRLAALEGAK